VQDAYIPNDSEIASFLDGSSILITGATGSFGQRCVRTLIERYRLRRLVVFSRDEMKQASLAEAFPIEAHPSLRYFIGDVRDQPRLELAMRGIDYVIHSAAMKIVPTAEYNPFECVRTNINGAENVVRAALNAGVKRVIGLSTDKAVNPINLYGATKLAAEKILVAANAISGADGTRYSIARYGNVIGSRGSVVQVYRKLIATGAKDLPVTDPRMTRFWITLEQGVQFVLTCLASMRGGEVFVPKLPSLRVTDLARWMAPELPHRVIGIRPGEKLHEVLVSQGESANARELADRFVIFMPFSPWEQTLKTDSIGRAVPDLYEYSSDRNDQWLKEDLGSLFTTADE
jgi:UDP-N-acetylglucosamine 4,6-dehydratase